jgi:hypothetical protein
MKLKQDEPPGAIAKQATQEVQDLISARWVADMIGVAAELQLADFINTGAKTAEEIAKTKGLHATSLYRLLRALASYGIFAEQEDGTFAQTPRSDALRKDLPHFCVEHRPTDNQALVGAGLDGTWPQYPRGHSRI